MRLVHYYHVYADGLWQPIVADHLNALRNSDLIDELDIFKVGIVGSEDNRANVKDVLRFAEVIAEAESGWEQVTLTRLHEDCQTFDGAVFYGHTKGAWSQSSLADAWRVSMTHYTVTRWMDCVDALTRVQAAGPYWLTSKEPEHKDHRYFFAGNFWWARADYLRTLPKPMTATRYQAEGWIGLAGPTVLNMREGYSYWGNFWQPGEAV